MARLVKFLLKNWHYIALAVVLVLSVYLANRLKAANQDIATLTERLKVSNGAVKILATQLVECDRKIAEVAQTNAEAFEQCQATAASSDSAAFTKGVEVGKIIGAKQCTARPSSPALPSSSAPATPQVVTR